MVKALARAFRWRQMLDGVHATLEDRSGPVLGASQAVSVRNR